jgi:hypothetical protein|tara:strand:- start:2423 stop:2812 length:390 start_codon:yes stop_codon:yes gene_type:complete
MIDRLIVPISDILEKLIPDKDLKIRLKHELESELHKANLAQLKVNQQEAAHNSLFVAGWRPFIGWVCGVALCWHFILQPITVMIIRLAGYEQVILPDFDFSQLSTILMGMLGLGGLRTFEKMKGVSREQ